MRLPRPPSAVCAAAAADGRDLQVGGEAQRRGLQLPGRYAPPYAPMECLEGSAAPNANANKPHWFGLIFFVILH